VLEDADGTRHVRYDRLVDGLPVVGGDHVVAKAPDGPISDQQWNARKDVSPAPETATVSSASAERTARGAAGYPTDAATSRLVVFASFGTPRLAWQVTTTGIRPSQTPSRLKTWVDARSGAVVDSAETIAEGMGNTMYSDGDSRDHGHERRQRHVPTCGTPLGDYTTDLKGATSATGTEITGADDTWATAPRQDVRPLVPTPSGGAGDVRLPPRGVRPSGDLEQRCRGTQPGALRQRVRPGEAG
jgi:Zn-dependent metalloprotease